MGNCTLTTVGSLDLDAYRNDTFEQTFVWKDAEGVEVDLTDYTARMQIRASRENDTVLKEITNGGGITLGGIAGTIQLKFISGVDSIDNVYDLELTDAGGDGTVTTLITGRYTEAPDVSRD